MCHCCVSRAEIRYSGPCPPFAAQSTLDAKFRTAGTARPTWLDVSSALLAQQWGMSEDEFIAESDGSRIEAVEERQKNCAAHGWAKSIY